MSAWRRSCLLFGCVLQALLQAGRHLKACAGDALDLLINVKYMLRTAVC